MVSGHSTKGREQPCLFSPDKTKKNMKVANARLVLNKFGSDVALTDITPAEVLFLTAEHHTNAGKAPVTQLIEKDEVERTVSEELDRLTQRYPMEKLSVLFHGAIPTLPSTFEEAVQVGIR